MRGNVAGLAGRRGNTPGCRFAPVLSGGVDAPQRVTDAQLDVLEVFLTAEGGVHGWYVSKATGRSGPTVYKILARMSRCGWIAGRWTREFESTGLRTRRYFWLTDQGVAAARGLLAVRRGWPAPW